MVNALLMLAAAAAAIIGGNHSNQKQAGRKRISEMDKGKGETPELLS